MIDVPIDDSFVINGKSLNLNQQPEEGTSPEDERPPLMTEGIYSAVATGWEKGFNPMYKKHFLRMYFQVNGKTLEAFFNTLPLKHDSYVKAGWTSNLARQYQDLLDKPLERRDRIAPNQLMNRPMEVEVITKDTDSEGRALGKYNQFSKVSRMIRFLD